MTDLQPPSEGPSESAVPGPRADARTDVQAFVTAVLACEVGRTPPKGPRARRRTHDWVNERDRGLHAAIAVHLRRDRGLLRIAIENLDRFEPSTAPAARWAFQEWRRLIRELPLDALLEYLVRDDERATALRQSAPFYGILPSAERGAIFADFETL